MVDLLLFVLSPASRFVHGTDLLIFYNSFRSSCTTSIIYSIVNFK